MAVVLRKAFTQTRFQVLPGLFISNSANPSHIIGSICVIPSRTKISKTSPFGKRRNPKEAQRETFVKTNPNIQDMVGKSKTTRSPVIIDSTGTIVSHYVPLDKKAFMFTPTGLKQRWSAFKNGLWTIYSLAFIKKYCKPFKLRPFAREAQEIYIDVNKALMSKDKKKLEELATGSVYHALKKEFFPDNKQLHWRFVRELERPRVVHARVVPVDSKENLFAQVTVKVITEQVMAVKDNHGRHIKGSDKIVKLIKDYVVLERHLPSKYGRWRVCGKAFQPSQQTETFNQLTASAQPSS